MVPGAAGSTPAATITTPAALRAALGRRGTIRRHPTIGPPDRRRVDPEPAMAPTRGLTPAITTAGPKTYEHGAARGVAWAAWADARERVPVRWFSWEEWRARPLPAAPPRVDNPEHRGG